jgi:hypothetical protein
MMLAIAVSSVISRAPDYSGKPPMTRIGTRAACFGGGHHTGVELSGRFTHNETES